MTNTIDIKGIIARVQKLQDKTIENGCTEAEAMSAAAMVAKIMNQYSLGLSDIQIKERDDCEEGSISTGRKVSHDIVYTIMAIGALFDCRAWRDRSRAVGIRFCFFGFPEDVAACTAMYHLILNAMDTSLLQYKRQCFDEGLPTGRRQSSSFLKGMSFRIDARLREIKAAQKVENKETTGRDLVVVKSATVETEFAKQGLRFKSSSTTTSYGDAGAYTAGAKAGSRVNLGKSVTGASQARRTA